MKKQFILNSFGLATVAVKPFVPLVRPLETGGGNYQESWTRPEATSMSTAETGKQVYSKIFSGVPVWCDFYLKEQKEGGKSIQILQSIVTLQMKKTIVKTAMQGRNGTVKEYINNGDWQISIRGAFADNNPYRYPIEDVTSLNDICNIPEALEVVGEFFQLFNIHNLVIEDYEFPQRQGYQNMQAFNIKAVSDEPIELILKD
jgi:hypothetical protein